jgi:MYXO-CTERM domain-containing protein
VRTATAVRTSTANEDDGCSIVAPAGRSTAGGLLLLLAPALLIAARRRRL